MYTNSVGIGVGQGKLFRWLFWLLVVIATSSLATIEIALIFQYGFPNSYILPILSIYIALMGMLWTYKRNRYRKKNLRRKAGLSKIQVLVLVAVNSLRVTPRQIEEYVLERHKTDRTEIFIAIALLIQQGYLKDINGQYHLTEKADIVF